MILKAGLQSGYQSVLELVDAAIPSEELKPFRHTILQAEGVKGCNRLRGRRAGSYLYLDVNIEVDPYWSVSEAYKVAKKVRHELQRNHPQITEVFTHIEPSTSSNLNDTRHTEVGNQQGDAISLGHTDVKDIVANILASNFSEKMVVKRVTPHLLQGQILLQIEVSMPPDILVRDAVKIAEAAEKQISDAVPNILRVCIQLRLGGPEESKRGNLQ